MGSSTALLKKKLSVMLPLLNEQQRRALVAAEANAWGRGGSAVLARITGMSRTTIRRGRGELARPRSRAAGIRRPGGGRKRLTHHHGQLKRELEGLLDDATRGDPQSALRWSSKSTRHLARALARKRMAISHTSVALLLQEMDYNLQANRKTQEGKDHPDRDAQFGYINAQALASLRGKRPVISVDTKKKELVGHYKNPGQEWQKAGQPIDVRVHDFPDPKVAKAVPYGVYDIYDNKGWVNVGTSADTAEFAVQSIRYWWQRMGQARYPKANELLICADSGGSNGYRSHLWKLELQKLADREKLKISVCHFPPGTSKWNKVEHKLFSFITMNWRGRPLTDYRTIVKLIAATRSTAGLTVKVRLDKKKYQKGVKVPAALLAQLNIQKHDFHGEWNYTIAPRKKPKGKTPSLG
ncbi:MAG: ISAzo13 family transposase [Burkholderiales bacterium]